MKPGNVVRSRRIKDIVPLVVSEVNGRVVQKTFVDSGAEICVMSEKLMHRLGLDVHEPAECGAKMANNVVVNCVGKIRNLKVKVCGVQVEVDIYVMPMRGEGYPLILGRPWLLAIKARQDWETGALELRPSKGLHEKSRSIVYNMKEGRQESLEIETTTNEEKTSGSESSIIEAESSSEADESSLEVMGITFPKDVQGPSDAPAEGLEKMLSRELTSDEKESYMQVLNKHSALFILDYDQIKGVTVIQHHIKLKENAKPVAQKLQ